MPARSCFRPRVFSLRPARPPLNFLTPPQTRVSFRPSFKRKSNCTGRRQSRIPDDVRNPGCRTPGRTRKERMSEHVFKGVEIVGTSDQSFSHAIEVAVKRARQTLRELSWFVVEEMRGG